MTGKRYALACLGILVSLFFAGCGGSAAIGVQISPGSPTVDGGDGVTLTATLTNSSSGVTWSLSGAGALSGQTTTSVTYTAPAATSSSQTASVTATAVGDTTKTASATITVPAKLSVTNSATSLNGATGPYSAQLVGSGGIPPYKNWAVAAGSTLPSCLTLNSSTGVITFTTNSGAAACAAASPYDPAFTFQDSGTPTPLTGTTPDFTITLASTPISLTPSVGSGAVGTAYTGGVTASGGAGTLTYAVASGALPPDLTLNTATGAITGTPKAADVGTATFKISASDIYGDTAVTNNLSIQVTGPTITFPSSLLGASVGTAYSQSAGANGALGATTYSIVSGSLPASGNLALNLSTGLITGTPHAGDVGTATFQVKVVDAYNDTATSGNLSIVIAPAAAIQFTGTVPGTGSFNSAYSTSYSQLATGGAGALTYSISSGALPTDLSLNTSTGAITGTPNKAADVGTFNFTIKAADAYGDSKTQGYTLVVTYPAVNITTATTLPVGYGGVAYTDTLAATGGNGGPYTWAVTVGSSSLTAVGLGVSSAGVVSGTTPLAGTATFTVTATDSASNQGSQSFTVTINPALTITTAGLPQGYVGAAYSTTLTASGGSNSYTTWTVTAGATGSNSLASVGLSLNSSTGVLSGSTPIAGTANFTVQVTDSAANTASKQLSVTINQGVTITTANPLPTGQVNETYGPIVFAAGGGAGGYTWLQTGGTLPTGVTFTAATATLAGVPTQTGSFSINLKVTDSAQNVATGTFNFTIYNDLNVTPTTLPTAYVGNLYSQSLTASGGSGSNYTFAFVSGSSTLTATGLNMSSAGAVSGTPTATGTPSFVVKVTDSTGDTANFTIGMTVAPGITISTSSPLPSGYAGTAYSTALSASGGTNSNFTWSVISGGSSLTALGLNLSGGGTITGNSPTAGTANFTAQVTDSGGNTATKAFSVTIEAAIAITTTTLPSGSVGVPYTTTLAASGGSGAGTYTWQVTAGATGSNSLATVGLSLNTSTGVLSGSSPTAGTANFTVQVTDSQSHSTSASLSVTIYTGLTITSGPTLPSGYGNTHYSQTLQSAGGTQQSLNWTVTSNQSQLTALNLTLSSGGVLSGTPPLAGGSATFGVKVTDSASNSATATLSVTFTYGLAITSGPDLLVGVQGHAYNQQLATSGGTGTGLNWTVTSNSSGLAAIGLSLSSSGVLSGNNPTQGSANFSVQVTDSASNVATATLSVTINGPLTITSGPTLPSGTVGTNYSQQLAASGGSQQNLNWSVTSNSSGLAGLGLSLSSSGLLSGSNPTQGTATFGVQVTDSLSDSTSTNLTVTINPAGGQISGNVALQNYCYSNGPSYPVPFTVTLTNTSTSATLTTGTDEYGNYTFTTVPFATYNITVATTHGDASHLYSPTSYQNVTLSSGNSTISQEDFEAEVGFNVSGTVTNSGSQTGPVHLSLATSNCGGGNSEPGTSISSGGAFTIHGVQPGSYNLYAWMDSTGVTSGTNYPGVQGQPNANDPIGENQSGVSVIDANVSEANVTLNYPTPSTPSTPSMQVIPAATGVVIFYNAPTSNITIGTETGGVEAANEYQVQWAATDGSDADGATCSLGSGNNAGQLNNAVSHTFYAVGTGATVWILNNTSMGSGTFASGTKYCFQARAVNTLDTASPHSAWFTATDGLGNPQAYSMTNTLCSTGCTTISGAITVPATPASGAPLYVGVYQQAPGSNGPSAIYVTEYPSPTTGANTYSIAIPNGSNYYLFGILDQNNDGQIDVGDDTNVNNDNGQSNPITASGGNLTGQNATLPAGNSTAVVQTSYNSCGNGCTDYSLDLRVSPASKQPVNVQLTSGPNTILPVDIGQCLDCGNGDEFDYSFSLLSGTPTTNDTYDFTVNYSDGTEDQGSVVNGKVTAWSGGSTVVAASDAPSGLSTSGSNPDEPNFSWTDSSSSMGSNFYYSFYIQQNSCNGNCTIWQVPGNNSNSNGFSSSTTSLTWGQDPISGDNQVPSGPLSPSYSYSWTIQVQDNNGNQASTSANYQP